MKKSILFIEFFIILFFSVFIILDSTKTVTIEECRPVYIPVDYKNYSYIELKNNSELIVLAEICDELDSRNSVVEYDDVSFPNLTYSVRHAKVVKVYKNDKGVDLKDFILVIEPFAVLNRGYFYSTINEEPLIKNNRYVLFLNKKIITDRAKNAAYANLKENEEVDLESMYEVLCVKDGRINLTQDRLNNNSVKISFLFDYETENGNSLTETIIHLDGKDTFSDSKKEYGTYYEEVNVDTNYGRFTIKQADTGNPDKLYFEVSSDTISDLAVFSNFQ